MCGQLLLRAEADLALSTFVGAGSVPFQLQALPTFLTQLHLPTRFLLWGATQSSATARVSAAFNGLLYIIVSGPRFQEDRTALTVPELSLLWAQERVLFSNARELSWETRRAFLRVL